MFRPCFVQAYTVTVGDRCLNGLPIAIWLISYYWFACVQSRRGSRVYLVSRESRMFLNKLIHIWSNSKFVLFSRSPVPARVTSHVLVIQPPGQTLPGHPNPAIHACTEGRVILVRVCHTRGYFGMFLCSKGDDIELCSVEEAKMFPGSAESLRSVHR